MLIIKKKLLIKKLKVKIRKHRAMMLIVSFGRL